MAEKARVYNTLDGMRGIAAIAVVILHAQSLFSPLWCPNGGLAVDLFFVMSGFIIAHAYEARLRTSLSRLRFIVLRLIRLYPLYLLGLLLGITEAVFEILFGRTQAWSVGRLVTAVLFNAPMLPAPGASWQQIFPLNPPGWSLFFELVINIAYVLALPLLTNRVLAVIAATSAAALATMCVFAGNLNFGSEWAVFGGGFARVGFSFTIGILGYRLRDAWRPWKVSPLLLLGLAAVIFTVDAGPFTGVYQLACVLLIMPAMVLLGSATEPGPRLQPAFRFLGLTSYAVYSIHYPLVMASKGVVRKLLPDAAGGPTIWIGLIFLVALLIGCAVIDKVYDTPVRRWLTRLGRSEARELAPRSAA
jgi:peptidoglycan/LPS O-acetylase OafA/YrhL